MKTCMLLMLVLSVSSCYAEWDVPKVPRQDPCTHELRTSYVYVQPVCPSPPPPNPRDVGMR